MRPPELLSAPELKRLLSARGIRPRRRLGQHFMVDRSALRTIVERAELTAKDAVLEPGAGPGNLTALLAARAGRVVAVELDEALCEIAEERLAGFGNVHLIRGDAMGEGETINPAVGEALAEARAAGHSTLAVVANLPYRVATSLIAALILNEPTPERLVVTVQREVADRLAARPGSRDYGYLSVIVQATAEVRRLRTLAPRCFWPEPEVESALVEIRPDPARPARADELARLRRMASALFTHRRKQLARALVRSGLAPDRAAALDLCEAAGVRAPARPEELSVGDFLGLAAARWPPAGSAD